MTNRCKLNMPDSYKNKNNSNKSKLYKFMFVNNQTTGPGQDNTVLEARYTAVVVFARA